MQVIIDETQRLTSLVNELLDFSRLQTDALALNPAPYPFTASVQAITDRVSRMVQQNGYQVVFHPQAQVKAIADEQRIAQVVYNLVGNALTYTGEDKTVEIHQEVIGKMVRLTIHDSGKGIAPEELPLIGIATTARRRRISGRLSAADWACRLSEVFWRSTMCRLGLTARRAKERRSVLSFRWRRNKG